MEKVAAALHHFLMMHNIDPGTVRMVLRADSDFTKGQIEGAIKTELKSWMVSQDVVMSGDLRGLKLHGISIAISDLDGSRT